MNDKERIQQQFSKHAAKYVTSPIHAKGEDLGALVELAHPTMQDQLLDIATGGGHVANALAPLVQRVVALDLTAAMLKQAEKFIVGNGHPNVTFVQGDAEQLLFADASFSIVTCRIAPHHFSNLTAFVKESYRVLQKGGSFLLIDNVAPERDDLDFFYNTVEKKRDASHQRAEKKSTWLTLLETAGFTTEQLVTFSKTFPYHWWCKQSGLPEEEKQELEVYMLQASEEIQEYFQIQVEDGRLVSFCAQSVLIHCKK